MQQSMNTETSDVTMTLTKRIRKLNRKVSKQSKQIERMQGVVYQLLGGLFNHQTQNEILSTHIDILYGNDIEENEENEEDNYRNNKEINYDIWPTTRQGDMLLDRVESIEEQLREIVAHRESEAKEETNSDTDSSSDYEPSDDEESEDEESDDEESEDEESDDEESEDEESDNDSSSDYEPSDEEPETEPETESETDEEAEWDSDYEY
jgi:uncharacterized coiled-coil protein SlyX